MFTKRSNQAIFEHSFLTPFVTALLGARRVGKSTLQQHFAETHPGLRWVFLNMDKLEQREKVKFQGLKNMIEQDVLGKIGSSEKIWVAIDEAQKCPELFEQIKILYDDWKDKGALKFILTGSGFLQLHQFSAESLAGRIEIFYLREFALREAVALQHNIEIPRTSFLKLVCENQDPGQLQQVIETLAPFEGLLKKTLETELVWGGLPEIILLSSESERLNYLSNYLQTYLEKDVRAVKEISDLGLYRRLIDIIAEQTGSLRDDQKIINALKCHRETLSKYRGILEATLTYVDIYPFIGSSLKRIVKSPKGYFVNNGMISYLTGIKTLEILEKTGLIGARFENWFLKELMVFLDGTPDRSEIFYWRTSNAVEVDFIMKRSPYIYPFEVTYSTEKIRSKINHLKTFMREYPKAPFGFYLYNGEFSYDPELRIYFLPAWMID